MKYIVHATVKYDYEMDVPEEYNHDLDDVIDYCLSNDPTDLVKLGTTHHWDGFNYGQIDSVENKSTGKIYDLSEW